MIESKPKTQILIIDDDQDIWKTFGDILTPDKDNVSQRATNEMVSLITADQEENASFQLSFASQGNAGFDKVTEALANEQPYALAFIDIRMPPGWDGMETAARIRKIDPDIEIVIVTAFSDRSRSEIVKAVGTPDKLLFLRKPFDPDEITQLAVCQCAKWELGRREQQQRILLGAILATSPAAIFTTDESCVVRSWNKAAEEITGYSLAEVVRHPCLFGEQNVDGCNKIREMPLVAGSVAHEQEITTRSGEKRTISITSRPIRDSIDGITRVVSFWDITRRKEMEEQQRQSQKMEALGTLAGGVAHDLNNMLTPIFGYSELARIRLGSANPVCDFLKRIEESASKAAGLIRHILAFSRKQTIVSECLQLNELINGFSKMLGRLIREDIEIRYELGPDSYTIMADRGQMEQIVMNLVINARDAISGGGLIVVSTSHVVITSPLFDCQHQSFQGDYVLLSIKDNGHGMDERTKERIFDPFYTTKEVGQGTGMGLSTVLGIVDSHKGHIQLESESDQGTTFLVYLPCSDGEVVQGDSQEDVLLPKGNSESILIAEDSPDVRNLAEAALLSFGYQVTTACNGEEALQIFQENPDAFDLLLTDMVMPGMNGSDLARAVRKYNPDFPLLFMTGYGFEVDLGELKASMGVAMMAKPFTLEELSGAVEDILGGGSVCLR